MDEIDIAAYRAVSEMWDARYIPKGPQQPSHHSKLRSQHPEVIDQMQREMITQTFQNHVCRRVGPDEWTFGKTGTSFRFARMVFRDGYLHVSGDLTPIKLGPFNLPDHRSIAEFMAHVDLSYFASHAYPCADSQLDLSATKRALYEWVMQEYPYPSRDDFDGERQEFQRVRQKMREAREHIYQQLKMVFHGIVVADFQDLSRDLSEVRCLAGGMSRGSPCWQEPWEFFRHVGPWAGPYSHHFVAVREAMEQYIKSGASKCQAGCQPCELCGGKKSRPVVEVSPAGLDTWTTCASMDDIVKAVSHFSGGEYRIRVKYSPKWLGAS